MKITTIGIDLAKNVFQVHGVDERGNPLIQKKLKRNQVLKFFVQQKPCLIGMEAEVLIAYRSLWQNAYVERVNGSIRRECTDHIIVWNERHLKRVLRQYFEYYNHDRTHLGLTKETPFARKVSNRASASTKLIELPRVGGLHHRYGWLDAA